MSHADLTPRFNETDCNGSILTHLLRFNSNDRDGCDFGSRTRLEIGKDMYQCLSKQNRKTRQLNCYQEQDVENFSAWSTKPSSLESMVHVRKLSPFESAFDTPKSDALLQHRMWCLNTDVETMCFLLYFNEFDFFVEYGTNNVSLLIIEE